LLDVDRVVFEHVTRSSYWHRRPSSLLDVGCGEGRFLGWAKGLFGVEAVGLDNDADLIARAKDQGCHVIKHDLNQYPWPVPKHHWEVVVASYSLYYLNDLKAALEEARSCLKRNGLLCVTSSAETCNQELMRILESCGTVPPVLKKLYGSQEHVVEPLLRSWPGKVGRFDIRSKIELTDGEEIRNYLTSSSFYKMCDLKHDFMMMATQLQPFIVTKDVCILLWSGA